MARSDRPHHTALKAAGPTAAAAVIWGPEQLAHGGLAPVVVAAVVAVFVAAPLSVRLWTLAHRADAGAEALRISGALCLTLVTAGVMAQVMPATTAGTLVGAGLLCLGAVIPQLRAGMALPIAVLAALAALSQGIVTPWTLLDPVWSQWQQWLALSVGTGFLLAGTGFGSWCAGDPAVPGWRRGPWVTSGLGLLLFAACVTVWAQVFEVGEVALGPLPVLLAVVTVSGWGDRKQAPSLVQVLGLLTAYLWLRSPLAPDVGLFWPMVLLMPAVLGAGLLAIEERGAQRLQAGATAALAIGALAVGWPGFGSSAIGAAAAMLPLLLVLWTGGTHVVLRRAT